MKKVFFFILIALASAYSFAQHTSLAFESDRHERFWIYINGQQQNRNPESSIQITGLYPDWDYSVRIVMDNRRHSEMTTTMRLHHGQNNYSLNCDQRSGQIRLTSINRAINATVTLGVQMIQNIVQMGNQMDGYGNNTYPPQNGYPNQQHGNHHNNQQYPPQQGYNHNHNNQQYPPQGNHQYPQQGQYPPQQPPHGGHHHHQNPTQPNQPPQVIIVEQPAPAPEPVVMPCSDADFEDAKRTIEKADFEQTKLTIAKQIVASELMTAKQLAEIANLFDFEHTKLEFLKYAYPYCFDQNKYYMVNNVFDFSSSVDELNEYISK